MNNYRQGIVRAKDHPSLKFGQVVYIIEETPDLYRIRVHAKSGIYIISKKDLAVN